MSLYVLHNRSTHWYISTVVRDWHPHARINLCLKKSIYIFYTEISQFQNPNFV